MPTYTGGWEPATDWDTRALIADVGAYAGPWPIIAPFVANLPLDAGELDYIVCLPNPSGIATDLLDGTYPTVWRSTGRYRTGTFDLGLRTAGGAAAVDVMPVGAHLFLVWYDIAFDPIASIPQPSKAALELVPPSWASGASGSAGGHWSAWFDGDALTASISDIRNGTAYSNALHDDATDYTIDAAADMEDQRLTAQAGGTSLPYGYNPQDVIIQSTKDASGSRASRAAYTLSQEFFTFTAPSPSTAPPDGILDGLTEGIDYGANPDTGQIFDYEDLAPEFLGWADFACKVLGGYAQCGVYWGSTDGGMARVPEGLVAAELTYRAVESPLLPTDGSGVVDWQPYEVGVEVAHLTTTIPTPNSPPIGIADGRSGADIEGPVGPASLPSTPSYDLTLTLSDLGAAPEVTLISQSNYQDSAVPEPFDNYTVVPFSDPSWAANVEDHEVQETKLIFIRLTSLWGHTWPNAGPGGGFGYYLPEARYQQPRARYWIPDLDVAWHTVGGHFATVGPAGLKIKTPGVGWVDVVNGPA